MDSETEERIKNSPECQESRKSPAKAPLHPWDWTEWPWARVHVEYAEPVDGLMFLILVDAHSKWMEVIPLISATTAVTIEKLRMVFATHGSPEMLVSDNGTVFTSHEFEEFAECNAIRHVTTFPYHPSSNGLADGSDV